MLQGVGAAKVQAKRVLILYEAGTAYPGINLMDQGIRAALDDSHRKLEVYREYMESVYFPEAEDQELFREFSIRRYKERQPDVIITVGPSPLKFMIETHDHAFPGVPIVFSLPYWVPRTLPLLDSHFTGVLNDITAEKSIQAAVRLLPGTKHIIVVGGMSFNDIQVEDAVRGQLTPYESKFDIKYLTNLTMPDLLEKLHHLPDHTIVFFVGLSQDAEGTKFISASESAPMVAAAANAPVFVELDSFVHHGVVGGVVSSLLQQGRTAGELALRILNGEKPQDIPRVNAGTIPMFDWHALKRWGINESALPAGSIVLNRQPSFWELYKYYVVAVLLVLLAQAIAIAALLWQRTRRRKAEAELIRSEEKFSRTFRHSPLAISIVSAGTGRYVEVNESFEVQTGWRHTEVIGRTPVEIGLWTDPDQRTAFMKQVLTGGRAKDLEVRLRKKDGQIRISLGSAELIELHGEPCILSVFADITERKQAEEAMSGFSRRLIEAQEAERTRIARELHDDINQRLAMLAISLKTVKQVLPNSEVKAGNILNEAGARVADLESDIQALSHRLHSSKLEYLGLEAAASGLCKELSERQGVEIDFQCDVLPEDLSSEVSLCFFRVLQEALHNALKYSGVGHFEVAVTVASKQLQLRVHDPGAGFDPKIARNGCGLGLNSMKERLKLVSGELSIESKLGQGTTITARIPLAQPATTTGAAA
jgi:PAS domain S-box-containing protein